MSLVNFNSINSGNHWRFCSNVIPLKHHAYKFEGYFLYLCKTKPDTYIMTKHPHSMKTQMPKQSTENNDDNSISRRKFIEGAGSAAIGLTIVPSTVLGGRHVPPSDKINVAYIGLGTQGLRQLPELIQLEDVQITAVCDP